MAWDDRGGRPKPKPRGIPTQRSSGIPTYRSSQQQQNAERAAERKRQQQLAQQRQQIQDQQAARAWQQSQMQQRQSIQDQQAMNAQGQNAPASVWQTIRNWAQGSAYQGLTDQYGRPINMNYANPNIGPVDAWGVNQPYAPQLATNAHNVNDLMNQPGTMAYRRNQGILNNPSRKIKVNSSMYQMSAPSVPLDTGGGGYGGWNDWGGGGGGWNDNYVSSWYNGLINWDFGNPKK